MDRNGYGYRDQTPVKVKTFNRDVLAENGISMSAAQGLAEKAKLMQESINKKIANAKPYRKVLHIDGKEHVLENPEIVDFARAETAGRLFGLVGYLREAIQAKSAWLEEVVACSAQTFLGTDALPVAPDSPDVIQAPMVPSEIDEKDVQASIPAEELAEYLLAEASVAHLGKILHPGGVLHEINSSTDIPYEERSRRANGLVTDYPVTVTRVYDEDAVLTGYVELHDKWRTLETRLNWFKAKFKNVATDINLKAQADYQVEVARIQAANISVLNAYNAAYDKYTADLAVMESTLRNRRGAERRRVSALGIVIPSSLKPFVAEVEGWNGTS
jgi:hypothetical protein